MKVTCDSELERVFPSSLYCVRNSGAYHVHLLANPVPESRISFTGSLIGGPAERDARIAELRDALSSLLRSHKLSNPPARSYIQHYDAQRNASVALNKQ